MAEEESEKIIKMYEEMFADRYTEADPDYKQTISEPIPHPPCVTGYFTRSKRNFDGNRGGRGRGNWGNRGGRDWHRGQGHHHGNRHDYRDQGHHHGNRQDYRGQGHNGGGDRHYNRDRDSRYQPY